MEEYDLTSEFLPFEHRIGHTSADDTFHRLYILCKTWEQQQSRDTSTQTAAGYCIATSCN